MRSTFNSSIYVSSLLNTDRRRSRITIHLLIMAPASSWGPKGDDWTYDGDAKLWNLARGEPSPGFTIRTTEGPTDTSITLAPALSALVVVDMQNFFIHPRCNDHPTGLAAVERTMEVVTRCREVGIKVRCDYQLMVQ